MTSNKPLLDIGIAHKYLVMKKVCFYSLVLPLLLFG